MHSGLFSLLSLDLLLWYLLCFAFFNFFFFATTLILARLEAEKLVVLGTERKLSPRRKECCGSLRNPGFDKE